MQNATKLATDDTILKTQENSILKDH